jgi:hypothetical protein
MRRFYVNYLKWQMVSAILGWSHYTELLAISDDLARSFYEQQCIRDRWSGRELKRQKDSALFERERATPAAAFLGFIWNHLFLGVPLLI